MNVTLPGGYVDEHGAVHREVELASLTGRDEMELRDQAARLTSAAIITALLARCVRRLGSLPAVNENVARGMLVGDREFLVMRLFEHNCGAAVNGAMRCPNGDCRKLMDMTLSLSDMAVEQRPVPARHFHLRLSGEPAREITFRLPTGGDQEAVTGIDDKVRAATALLARCTGLGESEISALPAPIRDEIDAEMERRAPQADLEIEATCPECGCLFSGRAEWPAHCLANLVSEATGLERDVHVLAWHYHWSESDVLSMPRAKRRRYIGLIEEELFRAGEA
jgi:hypothetical protein